MVHIALSYSDIDDFDDYRYLLRPIKLEIETRRHKSHKENDVSRRSSIVWAEKATWSENPEGSGLAEYRFAKHISELIWNHHLYNRIKLVEDNA